MSTNVFLQCKFRSQRKIDKPFRAKPQDSFICINFGFKPLISFYDHENNKMETEKDYNLNNQYHFQYGMLQLQVNFILSFSLTHTSSIRYLTSL